MDTQLIRRRYRAAARGLYSRKPCVNAASIRGDLVIDGAIRAGGACVSRFSTTSKELINNSGVKRVYEKSFQRLFEIDGAGRRSLQDRSLNQIQRPLGRCSYLTRYFFVAFQLILKGLSLEECGEALIPNGSRSERHSGMNGNAMTVVIKDV